MLGAQLRRAFANVIEMANTLDAGIAKALRRDAPKVCVDGRSAINLCKCLTGVSNGHTKPSF